MHIKSRRSFLLFLGFFPLIGSSSMNFSLPKISTKSKSQDGFIIVNGWILKESDLI